MVEAALCVWDHVYRIVPEGYAPRDPPEVGEAVTAGAVRDIMLTTADLTAAANEFDTFCQSLVVMPDGFTNHVRLHPSKLDARLVPLMRELAGKVEADGFLHLPERIANGYMLFLAEMVARRRGMAKLTDSDDIFSIMGFLSEDGAFNEIVYDRDAERAYCSIVLPTILPGGLEHSSMQRVLDFRETRAAGRKQFRSAVNRLCSAVTEIQDDVHAKTEVAEFVEGMDQYNAGLLAAVNQTFRESTPAMISVGLPVALSVLGLFGIHGDPFSLSALAGGAGIGAISAMASTAVNNMKTWSPNYASYYLQLDNVFHAEQEGIGFRLRSFHQRFEEFMND